MGSLLAGVGDLLLFNYPRWYLEVWPGVVLMAAIGVPTAILLAGVLTALQTFVAEQMRGRVFGAALMVMSLVSLCGAVIGGTFGDILGPVALLNIQGVGVAAAGIYVIGALRRTRTAVDR